MHKRDTKSETFFNFYVSFTPDMLAAIASIVLFLTIGVLLSYSI